MHQTALRAADAGEAVILAKHHDRRMMSDFLLSQILATIAFACGIISFQFRNRRTILLWLFGSAISNACHFSVLDRPGPGVLSLIIGIRFLVSAFSTDRRLMYLFLGIVLVGFFLSNKNALSYLTLFATLLATYASFQGTDRRIRLIFMLCGSAWLAHNVLAGSPIAALMEAAFVTSNMVGYWRIYITSVDRSTQRITKE